MLRKLRLFYYNNKEKFWVTVGIIIFVIVLIQIINGVIKNNREEEKNNNTNESSIIASGSSKNETYLPSRTDSIISDSKVSKDRIEEDTNIIESFVNFGNANDVEGAYNLLSQDCKDEMFQTIDRFYEFYFKNIFNEKRSYDLENWDSTGNRTTYRIKYQNDIMATGMINEEFIEDYITVIEENDEKKLNINEFINKVDLEKKGQVDGLEANVTAKYYYYDYVEYDITFKNTTQGEIIIDTKDNTESVYLEDKRGVNYSWFGNEIANEELILNGGESVSLRIKFNKLYNQNRVDNKINFTDVRINNEQETLEINV